MDHSLYREQQKVLYEAMNEFVTLSASRPRENLTLHLAAALGPNFVDCNITVIWRPPSLNARNGTYQGATWRFKTGEARSPVPEKLASILESSNSSLVAHRTHAAPPYISFSRISGGRLTIVFSTVTLEDTQALTNPEAALLWLIIDNIREKETREYVEMFKRDTSGLKFLFLSFRALARAGEPARLANRVAKIYRNTGASFSQRIGEACDIIDDLNIHLPSNYGDDYIHIIADLTEAVMNEMLGVGWDVQNTEGKKGCQNVQGFLSHLRDLMRRHKIESAPSLRKVSRIVHIIGSLLPREQCEPLLGMEDRWSTMEEDVDLDLMAHWSRMYQIARSLTKENGSLGSEDSFKGSEARWRSLTQRTIEDVQVVLKGNFKKCHEIRFLPSWLRLWFCHVLLVEEAEVFRREAGVAERPADAMSFSTIQLWRFRKSLAYVIRECLRHFRYGREPNYLFQPSVFSAALRTLVEHHAIRILRLPRDHDIRGLLEEIGRVAGSGDYFFAAGHLQHVLEIYIAGQFLCEFKIKSSDETWDGWSMEEILSSRSAWKPGALKRQEFRKAFSIAAIFHDVGMVLFPHWSQGSEQFGEVDEALREKLFGVRGVLSGSAGELLKVCNQEIQEEGYYDPTEEPQLARWIEDCIRQGTADHCVLGAWFLHRICQNVEGLSSDTIQQAVRAVLLHRVVTHPIEVDRDPAAALLTLCDEVFMWKHSLGVPATDDTGRSFQSIAVDVRPQTTLFDYIRVKGLSLGEGGDGRLVGVLDLVEGRSGESWPEIEIRLMDPDYLDVPVHFIWLMMAQNLGRIRRSGYGWAPFVQLWSKIPGRLEHCLFDTQRLLDEVADQANIALRPRLQRWLSNKRRFGRGNKGEQPLLDLVQEILGAERRGLETLSRGENTEAPQWEWVKIGPLRTFHNKDIALSFNELGRIVESVLHDAELMR